jgi:hypothetical protein
MKPLLFIIVSLMLITGCENPGASNAATESKTLQPNDIPTAKLTTAELKAPENMKFISHEKIKLFADITNQGGGPAYLSVYSDFEFVAKNVTAEHDYLQWNTNQNSRVLASSIEHNKIENEFAIPQHLTKLLIQVWFYDGRPAISREVAITEEVLINF